MKQSELFTFILTFAFPFMLGFLGQTDFYSTSQQKDPDQVPTVTPSTDPLAVPELPENPTEFETGKYLYYYHCMPCHGDVGQGLTDEFRNIWVEDHRNCWDKGCHGGRPGDEGFPIPKVVPAVIGPEDSLPEYQNLAALEVYLHNTHPPQSPGRLLDDEYHALSVFLWDSNQKPAITMTKEASPSPLMGHTSTPLLSKKPTAVINSAAENPIPIFQSPTAAEVTVSSRANASTRQNGSKIYTLALSGIVLIAALAFLVFQLIKKPRSPAD